MNAKSEVNVENIEFKISSGSATVAGFHAVDSLLFVLYVEAEDSERDIERDILHHEHTKSR